MILNTRKCHYLFMVKDEEENETLQISSQQKMVNSKEVGILKITIHRTPTYQKHFHKK